MFVVHLSRGAFVSFPNFLMLQWIANTFGPSPDMTTVIHRGRRGDLRFTVSECPRQCGHKGYFVNLYFRMSSDENSPDDDLLPIALIAGDDVQDAIVLLQEAIEVISSREGDPRLPTVRIDGKSYSVDERLREARNIDDPADRFELSRLSL